MAASHYHLPRDKEISSQVMTYLVSAVSRVS